VREAEIRGQPMLSFRFAQWGPMIGLLDNGQLMAADVEHGHMTTVVYDPDGSEAARWAKPLPGYESLN
jgi:hypothetical protein